MKALLNKSRWLSLSSIVWIFLAQCIGITDSTYATKQNNVVTQFTEAVTKKNVQAQKNYLMLEYDLYFNTKLVTWAIWGLSVFVILATIHDDFYTTLCVCIWAFIGLVISLINNRPKAHISCQSDKITLVNTVIPLQNIKFATITITRFSNTINKIQLHIQNPDGVYILEYHRMKNLLSTLKFIQFLEKADISVVYAT